LAGDIVTGDGEKLARHDGIAHYTVGQGRRLGIAAMHNGQRMAVLSLDAGTRRVVVGARDSGTNHIALRDVNLLSDWPADGRGCTVRLRARDMFRPARVRVREREADVALHEQALPAPGQACVFYDGTRVLGGGFIRQKNGAESSAPRAR
jgi:tRNA-specific 2-thiouridylase